MFRVWTEFLVCVVLIAIAGSQLSRYGHVIAEKTGLGGTWIGLILLATVTSLPELITGASAVTWADSPNIAIGNVLGASVLNLAILVVLDAFSSDESIYTRASQSHILAAAFGLILIGFVGFSILLHAAGLGWRLGWIGAYAPIIVMLYVVAVRTVFRFESGRLEEHAGEVAALYPDITLTRAMVRYTLAALVVVSAGLWLPFIGVQMAEAMGWKQSFVGTLFVSVATTMPELVVTLSAMRLGALDMAISNVLGSNLFDIVLVAVDDMLYVRGPILANVSPVHGMTALSAMVMTGVVIVGLFFRTRTRVLRRAGWVSLFLFAMYLLNSYILFLHHE